MRWKKYCIDMDMTGITRKAAAEILADIFQTEYNFQSDENCYEVKDSTDKTWHIYSSDSIKAENPDLEAFDQSRTI